MMSLVDGDSGVHDVWSNGLLLDDRLDVLVDMVVNTLSSNGGSHRGRVCGVVSGGSTGEASTLPFELGANLLLIAVFVLLVHDRGNIVRACLGADTCQSSAQMNIEGVLTVSPWP